MKKRKIDKGIHLFGYIFALLIALICLFPLIWMFVCSFKSYQDMISVPVKFFPSEWLTESYHRIMELGFLKNVLFTLLVAISGCACVLVFSSMAGYVFARLEFYGKRFFWFFFMISMCVPGVTIQLTSFLVCQKLGMLNTFWVLVIPGCIGGYNIFFFRQFFLNIPNSLEDAARIDGCGRFRIFWSIFIPISKAPLVVMGAGAFWGYYNSFLWPTLTITYGNKWMQVQQVISSFSDLYQKDYGMIMAGAFISIIPPLIMFAIFQRHLTKGFVISGLK